MTFIHSSVYYLHVKTIFKIVYLQCIKHFGIRRVLFTLLFLVLFTFVSLIVLVFRLLDEILFFEYRKVDVREPVFIISNPRSGTTFMHRLMCLDEQRYSYTLLYHTILPSVTLFRLIGVVGSVDKRIGRPFRKTFDYLDGVFFKGWEKIHPMGFNKSEEDEGVYVFTGITPGIFLLCPYMKEIPDVRFPDNMKPGERRKLMNFYYNSLQRFMYATGKDKQFLSKNVMSTGRLESILELFPNARIIYLIRNPYESVPSFISMFTTAWKAHSPEIPEDSEEARAWGELGIEYYNYFHEKRSMIPPDRLVTVRYDDLVENPFAVVKRIYDHFGMEMGHEFTEKLQQATAKARKYKSGHSYSLEQYGMSREQVYEAMKPVFDHYRFDA